MKHKFIAKKVNNIERGAVLIIALMVASALSLLIISTLEMVTSGTYIANNHKKYLQSLYIADAGVEDSIKHLRANPSWSAGFSNKSFESGIYTVSINNSSYPLITITSTGTVNNNSVTIESQVEIIDTGLSEYLVKVIYWKEI